MEDFLLNHLLHDRHDPAPDRPSAGPTVRALLRRPGEDETMIEGVLAETFLIANGRVLVKLHDVAPPVGGDNSLWVDADCLRTEPTDSDSHPDSGSHPSPAPSVVLRSSVLELPTGQPREYALRTLSLTLSEFVAEHGLHVSLAPGITGMNELTLLIRVPVDEGTDYLWKFRQATRPCRTETAVWERPPAPFAQTVLGPKERAAAAHYVGQLPLLLTTRKFWSVFRWHDGELQHVIQFSTEAKQQRTLIRRFRMS